MTKLLLLALAVASLSVAQDNSNADRTIPFSVRSDLPGTCKLGQVITRKDLTPGSNVYICGSSNNWVLLGGGGATVPGSPDHSVQRNQGGAFTGDAAFQYFTSSTPTATGMYGLQIGSAEPDLSCCDGPGNLLSGITETGVQQINSVVFGVGPRGPQTEWSLYSARGTKATPSNIGDLDLLFVQDILGRVSGAYSYLGAYAWLYRTEYTSFFPGGVNFEFAMNDFNTSGASPQIGFHPIALGHGEFNNGTPNGVVPAGGGDGGSLAQLDMSALRLVAAAAQPACAAGVRGTFWVTQGGTGVKDAVQVCVKNSSDVYSWASLY